MSGQGLVESQDNLITHRHFQGPELSTPHPHLGTVNASAVPAPLWEGLETLRWGSVLVSCPGDLQDSAHGAITSTCSRASEALPELVKQALPHHTTVPLSPKPHAEQTHSSWTEISSGSGSSKQPNTQGSQGNEPQNSLSGAHRTDPAAPPPRQK